MGQWESLLGVDQTGVGLPGCTPQVGMDTGVVTGVGA